jgi:ribosomal protein L16 Arg81 hydroxylase
MHLLNKKEIEEIFNDGYLYECNSFFHIDKIRKECDSNLKFDNYLDYASSIRNKFLSGHTIIVINLENFNQAIREISAKLGRDVDVHMYLVPENGGDAFDFHVDDRDVYIHMIYGNKKFLLKEDNTIKEYNLSEGSELFIKKGVEHKAIPQGPSCLLSFGVNTREYYSVWGGITGNDL